MQARVFLRGALGLTATTSGLPSTCIPELALFVTRLKPVLRVVLGRDEANSLMRMAESAGVMHASLPVSTQEIGNTWSSLLTSDDANSALLMVVLGTDQRATEAVLHAEADGDIDLVGEALGYPRCCVAALPELSGAGALWARALVARSGSGPYPWTANRLATGWGGMSAVGELFPCSLHCPAANALGEASYVALLDIGLSRLAAALREQGLKAVDVRESGAVIRATGTMRQGVSAEFYG